MRVRLRLTGVLRMFGHKQKHWALRCLMLKLLDCAQGVAAAAWGEQRGGSQLRGTTCRGSAAGQLPRVTCDLPCRSRGSAGLGCGVSLGGRGGTACSSRALGGCPALQLHSDGGKGLCPGVSACRALLAPQGACRAGVMECGTGRSRGVEASAVQAMTQRQAQVTSQLGTVLAGGGAAPAQRRIPSPPGGGPPGRSGC